MSKKNKKDKKSPFPKTLYVTTEPMDGGEPMFLAHEEGVTGISEESDGEPVAIYQLVEVKTLKVWKELE